jgi:hypothetical protein
MQRYKILHRTYYNFSGLVRLQPHALRLRPREGHELRIESSSLKITPAAKLRWQRDAEDNSVAIATFDTPASQLLIESNVVIQQYNENPLDFLVADYATHYPFAYQADDQVLLSPYMNVAGNPANGQLAAWLANLWRPGERIQTYALLQRLCTHINKTQVYQLREEPGVQAPAETLSRGSGSCRDFAHLFMAAARHLGTRFAFCQRLPLHAAFGNEFRRDPCLGRSVPAGRWLEGLRSHHRRHRGQQSHRRRGGKAARVGAAGRRLVRRADGREHECGGMGDRAGVKDRTGTCDSRSFQQGPCTAEKCQQLKGAVGQRIAVEKGQPSGNPPVALSTRLKVPEFIRSDEKTGHSSMHQNRSWETLKKALSAPSLIVLSQRSPTRIKKGTSASAPAP